MSSPKDVAKTLVFHIKMMERAAPFHSQQIFWGDVLLSIAKFNIKFDEGEFEAGRGYIANNGWTEEMDDATVLSYVGRLQAP